MDKAALIMTGLLALLLLSIFAYTFDKSLTANAISRLRNRVQDYSRSADRGTSYERSATAASQAWGGVRSGGAGVSGAPDSGGYVAGNGSAAPIPTATASR